MSFKCAKCGMARDCTHRHASPPSLHPSPCSSSASPHPSSPTSATGKRLQHTASDLDQRWSFYNKHIIKRRGSSSHVTRTERYEPLIYYLSRYPNYAMQLADQLNGSD